MTIKHEEFNSLTPKTLYDILNIRLTVFVKEQKIMYVDTDYKDLKADHWMIYEDDKLISYARVFKPGIIYEDYYSIGRIATLKPFRNRGHATRLIREILTFYNHPTKISAQYYLKQYYESLGFKAISQPYIEEDIKHIAMVYTPK